METFNVLQIYEIGPRGAKYTTEGVGAVILEISKRLVKMGHSVDFLTGAASNSPSEEEIEGVKVKRVDFLRFQVNTWNPTNLTLARQLTFQPAAVKRLPTLRDYDIYHGHFYNAGLIATALAKLYHKRIVNHVHGSYYPVWDQIANPIAALFFKVLERHLTVFLAKQCDIQIHTATYSANLAKLWGAPPSKIHVVPNAVDVNRFNPSVEPGLQHTCCEYTLFTARRLVRKNGLEYLIAAMPKIRKNLKVHLVVAGDGPERRRLVRLARTLRVDRHVTFLGLMSNETIPSLLASCDIAVMPSLIEAPGLFLLEAMAMAKPVIVSSVEAVLEVVRDGENGVIIPPRDSDAIAERVETLLRDKKLRKKIGEKARKIIEKGYSLTRMAERFLEVYRGLLVKQ